MSLAKYNNFLIRSYELVHDIRTCQQWITLAIHSSQEQFFIILNLLNNLDESFKQHSSIATLVAVYFKHISDFIVGSEDLYKNVITVFNTFVQDEFTSYCKDGLQKKLQDKTRTAAIPDTQTETKKRPLEGNHNQTAKKLRLNSHNGAVCNQADSSDNYSATSNAKLMKSVGKFKQKTQDDTNDQDAIMSDDSQDFTL